MQHDLFSSLGFFQAFSAAAGLQLVRDTRGQYRPAQANEVLMVAQRLMASSLRGSAVVDPPAVVQWCHPVQRRAASAHMFCHVVPVEHQATPVCARESGSADGLWNAVCRRAGKETPP